ncbi:3-hydroxyacyl-CoA dehydrogenase family protein [Solilutibacter silvestris]|uniref:3-hydroxyacyl-CoA dehydrogenase n=1 Tax=Solilutibacter silvestris TaxID=1645665 RepID=A0A2K1Q012_9GAMM|nr:3-hydroxyacyl-CoA dehydrogenase NAD-binding domain-containing protein [Lysobacter silvestris]PNS08378.1 3-hydroxyacyl-CoA dehydrogenase [Lysobacter silvestris]
MRFEKIGVVGAGVIGRSVAQALAQTGHDVVLIDTNRAALDSARKSIADGLRFAAFSCPALRKADHGEILSRIRGTTDHGELAEIGFVIENTTEDWGVKEDVYRSLDEVCYPECVFVVNTSAICIARVAKVATRHPHIIGMHFMNPVPLRRHVEVVVSDVTSQFAVDAANDMLAQLGSRAIVVRDKPGFVSNRVMMLMINEAIAVLEDDTASATNVDAIFVNCFAHKMGPLATADLIGLDTIMRTLEVLRDSFNDAKFEPRPLLRRMVSDNRLGRKSGVGFFDYGQEGEAIHGP